MAKGAALHSSDGNRPSIRTALQAIDAALVAVRQALTCSEVAGHEHSGDWITQDSAPCGRRMFMRACRNGLIENARKVGRRWLVRREDFDRFVEEQGQGVALSGKGDQRREHDAGSPSPEVLRELERVGLEFVGKARRT